MLLLSELSSLSGCVSVYFYDHLLQSPQLFRRKVFFQLLLCTFSVSVSCGHFASWKPQTSNCCCYSPVLKLPNSQQTDHSIKGVKSLKQNTWRNWKNSYMTYGETFTWANGVAFDDSNAEGCPAFPRVRLTLLTEHVHSETSHFKSPLTRLLTAGTEEKRWLTNDFEHPRRHLAFWRMQWISSDCVKWGS